MERKDPVRLFLSWLNNPELPGRMKEWWEEEAQGDFPGYRLWQKLKWLKQKTQTWRSVEDNKWRESYQSG